MRFYKIFLLFFFVVCCSIFLLKKMTLNPRLIEGITKVTNPIFHYSSLVENKPIYDSSLLKTSQILTENWTIFRKEVLNSYENYTSIKGDQFFEDIVKTDKEWTKLYIKWHSTIDPIAKKLCPETCKIIDSLPDIKIAMFSVLTPHAKILPHRGLYKGCLRYHLGLATPNSEKCYISIGGEKYHWKDGEGILFDDTYKHWVENNTDKVRIILFCDIVRPMSFLGRTINKMLLNYCLPLTTRGN